MPVDHLGFNPSTPKTDLAVNTAEITTAEMAMEEQQGARIGYGSNRDAGHLIDEPYLLCAGQRPRSRRTGDH